MSDDGIGRMSVGQASKRFAAWLLRALAPALAARLSARRGAAVVERHIKSEGLDEIAAVLLRRAPEVRSGPFSGLIFPESFSGLHLAPKLLGSYESELHEAIERLIARAPARIVNVGSAEGYYSAGLAKRCPGVPLFAVDLDAAALRRTEELAQANGLDEQVRTLDQVLTAQTLGLLAAPGALLLLDCEGAEGQLLDPRQAPVLRRCDLLVELHPWAAPKIEERLRQRFAESHEIEVIPSRAKDPADYPELEALADAAARRKAVNEYRPAGQGWMLLLRR